MNRSFPNGGVLEGAQEPLGETPGAMEGPHTASSLCCLGLGCVGYRTALTPNSSTYLGRAGQAGPHAVVGPFLPHHWPRTPRGSSGSLTVT